MLKPRCSVVGWRVLLAAAALGLFAGCEASNSPPPSGERVARIAESAKEAAPHLTSSQSNPRVISSDEIIYVEDGKVTFGPPKVTEDVERQIYKTLSYYRNLAREIEAKVPGGNRGSQQSRQDFEFAKKSFMAQYGLSEADIASILKQGDEQNWK